MALPATPLDFVRGDASPGFDITRSPMASVQAAEQLHAILEIQRLERVLPLRVRALDAVLPQGGLVQGSVIELQVQGAGGAATSFALCACRAAQFQESRAAQTALVSSGAWCAFIDPSASLFAPGVARLGVDLERLLVVRPEVDAIERVAIRIAEAKAVALLVIDLRGALGGLPVSSQRWPRTVRRLALAVRQLGTCVLVITASESRAALPLPVAMRLEFSRTRAESFEIRVGKERSGRVSPARRVPWSVFDSIWPDYQADTLHGEPREDALEMLDFQHGHRRAAAMLEQGRMASSWPGGPGAS
jgi:recombination protein RecA